MALEHRYLNIKRRATHRVEATFAYCNYMRVHGSFFHQRPQNIGLAGSPGMNADGEPSAVVGQLLRFDVDHGIVFGQMGMYVCEVLHGTGS